MNSTPTAPPWTLNDRDRAYLTRLVDYSTLQSLPEIWPIAAQHFTNLTALHTPSLKPEVKLTYGQLHQQINSFAAGLQSLGIEPALEGELPPCVALFADNSYRWFIADQGMMTAGAANAVRSHQADPQELRYILSHSQSQGLVVENQATLDRLLPLVDADDRARLKFLMILTDEVPQPIADIPTYNFSQVLARGSHHSLQPPTLRRDTLATLIYTSGTTGQPKGVMLSHGNLLHQVCTAGTIVQPQVGDVALSILPTWHSYERSVEYFLLSQGCTQIYTSIRNVKKDLKAYAPQYMVSVPRIWESVYEGVQQQFQSQPSRKRQLIDFFFRVSGSYTQAKRTWQGQNLEQWQPNPWTQIQAGLKTLALAPLHLLGDRLVYQQVRAATGGSLKQVISGGGSLAPHLEQFYEIVGIELLVGYGLTETAPILSARRVWRNVRGSAGLGVPGTELRVVDPDSRQPLPPGQRGLVLARGPQVMQGYFRNPEATAKALDPEGWFDTGDLGFITVQGDVVLTGRAKDTIVLSNGENIEPQPLEDACLRSPYIDQIMLVGQDQKSLGALIVPNLPNLRAWAEAQNLGLGLPDRWEDLEAAPPSDALSWDDLLNGEAIAQLLRQELNREVRDRPSYRPDDRITVFRVLSAPFSMDNGLLTQTLKIRRPLVAERYGAAIEQMFAK
jgi:long-chain acyl-CoA synthetase